MKIQNKEKNYIFVISVLLILLFGLFVMIGLGVFNKNVNAKNTQLKSGENILIESSGSQAQTICYNIDGKILDGEKIKASISLKNKGVSSLFFRAKVIVFSGNNDGTKIELSTNENWIFYNEYYYFKESVSSLNIVSLANAFVIKGQMSSESDYIINLIVESLSTDFDRKSVWGY